MENFDALPTIQSSLSHLLENIAIPQRVLLSIFGFMAIVNASTLRLCMDKALVQMVKTPTVTTTTMRKSKMNSATFSSQIREFTEHFKREHNTTGQKPWCQFKRLGAIRGPLTLSDIKANFKSKRSQTPMITSKIEVYDWSQRTQTFIVSAFYVGYVIAQIPGGWLSQRYGGKWVLALGIGAAAVLTLLTPITVRHGGPLALIGLRVLIGLCEGPAYPALSALLAHWIPPTERGKLATFALSGSQIGIVCVNIVSTLLLHISEWTVIFYFFGACALIWFVCFILICYNEPTSSPYINSGECLYLQESISSIESATQDTPIPWRQILLNAPVWAMISSTIQYDWTQAQSMPLISQHFEDYDDGSFSKDIQACIRTSLPHLLNWLMSLIAGFVCDILVNYEIVSTTDVRRLMTSITAFGPTFLRDIGCCFMCFENEDIAAKVNCALGVMGTYYAGAKLTPLDLSPNYASILMAISNGLGSLASVLLPRLEECFPNSCLYKNLSSILCLVGAILTSGDVQTFDISTSRSNYKIHESISTDSEIETERILN